VYFLQLREEKAAKETTEVDEERAAFFHFMKVKIMKMKEQRYREFEPIMTNIVNRYFGYIS